MLGVQLRPEDRRPEGPTDDGPSAATRLLGWDVGRLVANLEQEWIVLAPRCQAREPPKRCIFDLGRSTQARRRISWCDIVDPHGGPKNLHGGRIECHRLANRAEIRMEHVVTHAQHWLQARENKLARAENNKERGSLLIGS
ncbi:MAG: hypothetical protein JNK04_07935 [Myxococcales bacterium]|nr:hypothetical protein [Myxococcales bacterium]